MILDNQIEISFKDIAITEDYASLLREYNVPVSVFSMGRYIVPKCGYEIWKITSHPRECEIWYWQKETM